MQRSFPVGQLLCVISGWHLRTDLSLICCHSTIFRASSKVGHIRTARFRSRHDSELLRRFNDELPDVRQHSFMQSLQMFRRSPESLRLTINS